MKYYGENTKKLYESIEDCEKAEKAFLDAQEQAKIKQQELADTKKARAKEVTDAYVAIREAQKRYEELRGAFIKDYGSFHMSFRDPSERFTYIEDLFNFRF